MFYTLPYVAFCFGMVCFAIVCSSSVLLSVGLEFNGLVNTIKVMSSQTVYFTTLLLVRFSPLSG